VDNRAARVLRPREGDNFMTRHRLHSAALVISAVIVTLAADRLATGQAEPAALPQGDAYRIERLDTNSPPETMAQTLNQMHRDGWELIDANQDLWVFKKKDVLNAPLRPR
jgi:hypothetical protein